MEKSHGRTGSHAISVHTVVKSIAIVNVICIILVLAFIFSNSLKNRAVSTEQSTDMLNFLTSLLPFDFLTEHVVRKLAHFCEFALLGFLVQHLWSIRRCVNARSALSTVLFGLLCAITDESLQMLSDRSAQLSDVLLDLSGVIFGCLFFFLLFLCRRTWKTHQSRRHN